MLEETSTPMPIDPESTQVLLSRAQGGDERAIEDLIARYVRPLERFAHGRLAGWARDAMDTQDIVQETLLNTVKRLENIESRGSGSFHAYLRTAVLNRIRDEQRRFIRRLPPETLEETQFDDAPSALEEALGKEAMERYEQALAQLSESDREAIHTRVELGLPYAMVAEAIGKPSADAARMAVSRALMKLAKGMAEG